MICLLSPTENNLCRDERLGSTIVRIMRYHVDGAIHATSNSFSSTMMVCTDTIQLRRVQVPLQKHQLSQLNQLNQHTCLKSSFAEQARSHRRHRLRCCTVRTIKTREFCLDAPLLEFQRCFCCCLVFKTPT